MKYKTRDFGEIDIKDSDILTFAQPLFGFEDYRRFALIYNHEIGESLVWLQSLDDPDLCFILFDPTPLSSFFKPELPHWIEDVLGKGDYICWVLCAIPDDIRKTTVNLKSPIFINPNTRKVAQIMLDQNYPIRFPLIKEDI